MITASHLVIEEIYNAYIEARDVFAESQESLDGLRSAFEEELSGFTEALDEVSDQLEQCRRIFRKLNRRMFSGSVLVMDNERTTREEQHESLFQFDKYMNEPDLPFTDAAIL